MIPLPLKRFAGASGSVTLPAGASIVRIAAHSTGAGSVAGIPDGQRSTVTIPTPAAAVWLELRWGVGEVVAPGPGDATIVFTGTDSYLLEAASAVGF